MGRSRAIKRKATRKERSKLTDKMARFAQEYVIDFNNKAAAVRAGYPTRTASVMACKLLNNPTIAKLVAEAKRQNEQALNLERDNVLLKLSQNLNRNLWNFGDEEGIVVSSLRDIPRQAHPYIDGFEVKQVIHPKTGRVIAQRIKIRLSPNAAAQDMAMRFIGAYAAEKHALQVERPALDYDDLLRRADVQTVDVVSGRLEQEGSAGD